MKTQEQISRLKADLDRALTAFNLGDMKKYRAIMALVASITYAQSVERSPEDSLAEVA